MVYVSCIYSMLQKTFLPSRVSRPTRCPHVPASTRLGRPALLAPVRLGMIKCFLGAPAPPIPSAPAASRRSGKADSGATVTAPGHLRLSSGEFAGLLPAPSFAPFQTFPAKVKEKRESSKPAKKKRNPPTKKVRRSRRKENVCNYQERRQAVPRAGR